MSDIKKYIVVVGRLHGDDEDTALKYANTTVTDAVCQFMSTMRSELGCEERLDEILSQVYITYVMHADTIIVTETWAGI